MLVNLLYGPDGGAQVYPRFANYDPKDAGIEQSLAQNIFQHPVTKHINRVSFLLEHLFLGLDHTHESFSLILDSTSLILNFNKQLTQFTESLKSLNKATDTLLDIDVYEHYFWRFAKSILFSQVIIFQGIVSSFLVLEKMGLFSQIFTSKKLLSRLESGYCEICSSVLNSLYYLNFILLAIGKGGFDGYNFIYYVSLELVLKNNLTGRFEDFSKFLIQNPEINLHHQTLNSDYVARCKVLFVFGMWENYLQQVPVKDQGFVQYLYGVTFDIVRDPLLRDTSLVEAAHSIMLSYFASMDNTKENLHKVFNYTELLVDQFPVRLSAHQLSVAIETLGKKIMIHPIIHENGIYKNSIDEFLYFVYFKGFNMVPGQRIKNARVLLFNSAQPISEIEASSTLSQLKKNSNNTDIIEDNKGEKPKDVTYLNVFSSAENDAAQHFGIRETPNTSREGVLMAFLNVIPYLPLSIFIHWLDKIWNLIMASNQEEQKFLIDRMWKCLSENLDLNRSEVAYDWWYETIRAAEINIGHQPTLFKL